MAWLDLRFSLRMAFAGAAALAVAGCAAGGSMNNAPATATTPVTSGALEPLAGGGTRVALILPLTGGAASAAASMKNAGEMALAEFNNPQVQLIVKDDRGTAEGARTATQEAIAEGAEIVLGPLFAQSVAAAGSVARPQNIPVVAFSTDASVAQRGVYLLSFLPQADVNRIISHAAQNGRRSFAALLPDSAYGTLVEGAFQEAVARAGGRVVALERYGSDGASRQAAAKRIASVAGSADAIFLPDGGDVVPGLVTALRDAGVDTARVALLGTGQWDDPRIASSSVMRGGLYAGPESGGWSSFSQRYRSRYGSDPVRTAALAYDAVLLTAALTQTQGENRFQESTLTNSSGFQGIDGIFRLRPDGTNERGLAVLRIGDGGVSVASPAPRTFGGGAGL